MESKIESKMLSLYDYLGKPSGGELGKEVYAAAKKLRVKPETREVSTKNYNGSVMLYPKEFLDSYFQKHEREDTLPQDTYDGGLPF
tara:strand:+ start:449 stop:706 length:258 start_codon:yes stop_codon:yes gene_type:complete